MSRETSVTVYFNLKLKDLQSQETLSLERRVTCSPNRSDRRDVIKGLIAEVDGSGHNRSSGIHYFVPSCCLDSHVLVVLFSFDLKSVDLYGMKLPANEEFTSDCLLESFKCLFGDPLSAVRRLDWLCNIKGDSCNNERCTNGAVFTAVMVEESVAVDDHFLDMNAERENRGCDYLEAEPIWSFSALDVIKQHKHHAGDTQENIDMAGNARVLFPVAASSRDEHNNPVIHEQVIGSFLTSMKKEHFVCGQCSEVLVPEKLHKCSEVLFKSSQGMQSSTQHVDSIRSGESTASRNVKQSVGIHVASCTTARCTHPGTSISDELLCSVRGAQGLVDVSFDSYCNTSSNSLENGENLRNFNHSFAVEEMNISFDSCFNVSRSSPLKEECGEQSRVGPSVAVEEVCPTGQAHKQEFSYIQPQQGGREAHLRQLLQYESASAQLLNIEANGFPHHPHSQYATGTVIYNAKGEISNALHRGTILPWIPSTENVASSTDYLGKGGNGTTFKYPIFNQTYAVKCTTYRPRELNLWCKFDHPHVVSLLAVVLVDRPCCFQFMPLMSCNMRDELKKIDCLKKLVRDEHPKTWDRIVFPNVKCLLRQILSGLSYLHQMNVQHCDLKPHNILVKRSPTCTCKELFHCCCTCASSEGLVHSILISDFDSIKVTDPTKLKYCGKKYKPKTADEARKIKGTMGYRAPEQFMKVEDKHMNTSMLQIEGPWSDLWSFGLTVLYFYLGHDELDDWNAASALKMNASTSEEILHATVKLQKMFDPELKALNSAGCFVRCCLQPLVNKRPTALELLENDFLQ